MKKKNKIWIYPLVLMVFVLMLTNSCKKKDDTPKPEPTTVTDIDGNVYQTIVIGTQTWMVENLKTTKYRNGDLITHITDGLVWNTTTAEAYCDYDNNSANVSTYGRLYNWYAVNDSRNIAPTGWHIPTDAEWTTLTSYLGGESVAGGKLKETGTTHWASPNTGATNESGFTALPGGWRYYDGSFGYVGNLGSWWSSTEGSEGLDAMDRGMGCDFNGVSSNYLSKSCGFSVRCVKDF